MTIVLEYDKHVGWYAMDQDEDGATLMMGVGSHQVSALIDLAENLDREWHSALDRVPSTN